jgi:glutathione S-transferase
MHAAVYELTPFPSRPTGQATVKKIREEWVSKDLPRYMRFLTAALEQNGGPFLAGSSITLADVWWLPRIRYLTKGIASHVPATCLEGYPEVLAWKDRMMSEPKIAAWYASTK